MEYYKNKYHETTKKKNPQKWINMQYTTHMQQQSESKIIIQWKYPDTEQCLL